jgi:hypothetical protein
MTATSAIAELSNVGTEAGYGISRSAVRYFPAVMRVAHGLWPAKTADHLADCGGVSKRRAEQLLAEETSMSGDTLARLLQSEHGFAFLEALMRSKPGRMPEWWDGFQYQVKAAQVEAEIAAARDTLRKARKKRIGR